MNSYQIKVKDIIKETDKAVSIVLDIKNEDFKYASGQFVTLVFQIDGKEYKRSYSLSSSPFLEDYPSFCVKALENGKISNHILQNVKVGDFLKIEGPLGNLKVVPSGTARKTMFFAAGSGITPMISIIKTILTKENTSQVVLIFGNRTENDIIFKKELESLCEKFYDRFIVEHVLSAPSELFVGRKGRINEGLAVQYIKKFYAQNVNNTEFYLCGPVGMMEEVLKGLDLLNVNKNKIFKENFHVKELEASELPKINTGMSKVKIIDGKKTFEFEVSPTETILEKGLSLGFSMPYSCQAGMCTACMGKCTSGKIQMTESDGLTDSEIKQGYVLTCVSHAMSEEVVIEL